MRQICKTLRTACARLGPVAGMVSGLGVSAPAWAGPPFVTDDPVPTETGHWEIYTFAGGSHTSGDTGGQAGFDINYGAATDLQLTLALPVAFEDADGTRAGRGTVEIAAKYRFLHQDPGSLTPDLAFFPRVFAPTAPDRFGSGRWGLLLPLWAQKDIGKWQVFGGFGYDINPGAGNRDFWTGGVAVQRPVNDRLSLGAEVYHHGSDAIDARPYTGLNLGMVYKLAGHWSLLAAGGPGVQNAAEGGRYDFYLALKADY